MLIPSKRAILIVEDSDDEFVILQKIMHKLSIKNEIYRCCDGKEALDFLYHRGEYQNPQAAPRPSIILLDINLPVKNGKEVLKNIKQNDNLKTIPAIMFTTSDNPEDINFCYQHGANSYMLKPIELEELKKTVRVFVDNWLDLCILP